MLFPPIPPILEICQSFNSPPHFHRTFFLKINPFLFCLIGFLVAENVGSVHVEAE